MRGTINRTRKRQIREERTLKLYKTTGVPIPVHGSRNNKHFTKIQAAETILRSVKGIVPH